MSTICADQQIIIASNPDEIDLALRGTSHEDEEMVKASIETTLSTSMTAVQESCSSCSIATSAYDGYEEEWEGATRGEIETPRSTTSSSCDGREEDQTIIIADSIIPSSSNASSFSCAESGIPAIPCNTTFDTTTTAKASNQSPPPPSVTVTVTARRARAVKEILAECDEKSERLHVKMRWMHAEHRRLEAEIDRRSANKMIACRGGRDGCCSPSSTMATDGTRVNEADDGLFHAMTCRAFK